MLGATLEVLDTSIANVALPYMQGSFSASADQITWVLTSYLVSNGIMIPLTGWISSRFGRKRYFITSIAVFVAASGMCGAAESLTQMVMFRLIQGAAGAAMIPTSQAILMETFPPAEQGLAMATWGVGLMLAPIMGPTLGGWITINWNWRWNFYINLPTGILAALMVFAFVHDPEYLRARGAERKTDWVAIACLTLGLGLLQIVLDRGQRSDWFSAGWVWWFSIVSAVSFLVLVIHEMDFLDPILDFRMFLIRDFTTSVVLITVMVFVLFGVNLLNPLFLQELMGYDAWKAGLAVAPRGIGVMISMLGIGQLSRKGFDTRPWIGIGFIVVAYSAWEMSRWDLQVSMEAIMIPIVLLGFGGGLIFPVLSAAALASVERSRMGYASSLYNMMRNTGSAIGISLVGNMLTSHEQIHQSYLASHVTPFSTWAMSEAAPRMAGAPPFKFMNQVITGQRQGLGMVYRTVEQQAALLSYNDVYRVFAIAAVICIPGFLWLSRTRSTGGGATH